MLIFNKLHPAVLIIIMSAALIGLRCHADPDVTVVYCGCSGQKYSPDYTDYDTSVKNMLRNLVDETSVENDSFNIDPWPPEFTLFGRGSCSAWITGGDVSCSECMYIAARRLKDSCPLSVGAQLELVDCRIRYEDYQFD